jgi:hypothetical protein
VFQYAVTVELHAEQFRRNRRSQDLLQVELETLQQRRSEIALDLRGAVQVVAAFLEREDLERFVGGIANPVRKSRSGRTGELGRVG